MTKKQLGFTLIELMIVVAIIGILAAVAIPAYTDYLKRSKVGEAVNLMGGLKTPTEEYISNKGEWPENITTVLGGKVKGKYTSMITSVGHVADTVPSGDVWTFGFRAIMKDVLGGNDTSEGEVGLAYNPAKSIWSCTNLNGEVGITNGLEAGLVPSNCRGAPTD